jgi:uncharacterized protein YhaN
MKLIEARIDGFGELNDRSVDLDAPVIVVYGPNEAGKSTLFGFLRTMLYGFPRRSSAERHEPARGGKHGGRLAFSDAEGRAFLLERYAGSSGGKPVIRLIGTEVGGDAAESGSERLRLRLLEQADWEQRYLGGVQERLYRQLYAVTLSELMEVGTLSGGELSRYLYQAGWEEGRAVAAAEKRIQAEMDELFKPRGSAQRLNGHAKSIEALDAELRGLKDDIERFNELAREGEAADRELELLAVAVPEAEERVRLLRKAVAARPLWLRSRGLRAEEERLRYASILPQDSAASWMDMLARRSQLEAEETRLRKQLDQHETALALIAYDESLIAKGAECEAVLQAAERIRNLAAQRTEWQAELETLDEYIAKVVSGISPEWTEKQLRELVITVADRDYVRGVRETFEAIRRKDERLMAERETLLSQQAEAKTIREEAASALRGETRANDGGGVVCGIKLLPLASVDLTSAWTAVDEALRGWELEQARMIAERATKPPAKKGSNRSLPIWGVGGIGAGAALAIGAAAGWLGDLSPVAFIVALLLFGASAGLLVAGGRRRGESAEHAGASGRRSGRGKAAASPAYGTRAEERLAGELARLVADPAAALAALLDKEAGGSRPGARSALQSRVASMQEQLARRERLASKLAELEGRLSKLGAALQERESGLSDTRKHRREAESAWNVWLGARHLPNGLSPTAALETFELADQAMERLRQYDRLAARIAAANLETEQYASHAARLSEGFEEGRRQARLDPTLALALLLSEARRQASSRDEAQALRAVIEESASALGQTVEQLESLAKALQAAMKAAGIDGEPAYAAALQDRSRLDELRIELTTVELELGAGQSARRMGELEKLWHGGDEHVLQRDLQLAEQEASRLAEARHDWLERRGRVKQATEHLMNEDKRSALLAERAMSVAALEEGADRYAVLAVSRELIKATRRKFEQERQPAVLRNAAAYMKLLSQGRYVRVSAGGHEDGIVVERSDGAVMDSGLLSRGTAEQLYLCMRLALAEEAGGASELPMLLDDLFVNFDRSRLRAAAGLMSAVSSKRQLILFTCHEHIRDELLAACPDAKLVDMSPQPA